MKYTKKISRSKGKSGSRKYGGKKENNYAPTLTTQMAGSPIGYNTLTGGLQRGGAPAPVPAPAPAVDIGYNTNYTQVYNAMSNFGNSIIALQYYASNALTVANARLTTAGIDSNHAVTIATAGSNLLSNFLGNGSKDNGPNSPLNGLYQVLLPGSNMPPVPVFPPN